MPTPFDAARLKRIAARIRAEEQTLALTGGMAAAADLARQPKIQPRLFQAARFHAAVSPDSSYRLVRDVLAGAKHEILLYIYNAGADYLLDLLRERMAAGVSISVMVDPNDPNDGKSKEWQNLKKLGVDLKEAPSKGARRVFTVCHQKYVVVDGKTLLVESANWAKSSIPLITAPGEYKPGNREWFLRVDDPAIALWFKDLFQQDWNIPAAAAAGAAAPAASVHAEATPAALYSKPERLFDIRSSTAQANVIPVISPVNYLSEVGKLLKKAAKSIDIQQQYIKAGDGVDDLLEILHAKQESCDIRIITSPKFEGWQDTQDTLRAAGLARHLKALNLRHFVHCHNKGVIVDRRYVVVSSTNWSENSIVRAREAGLLVDSEQLAGYFSEVFDEDWKSGLKPSRVAASTVELNAADLV